MAPESSKQKQTAKQNFDDEFGDDFLSSWKPTKSMAALDFEEDEPTPKNCKASFSLGKMDTSFDFDFDGGMNALSKFNVDMSDLDLPSSRDKPGRTKDTSQDKPRDDSKFSFQFNGFDELDLDDTLKTNKESETPVHSKKGKRDLSPPSTASRYYKKGLPGSFSENTSESTSAALAGTSMNKETPKSWKEESTARQGKISGGLTFSDDENSMHELDLPLQDKREQAPRKSENYTTQKRQDSAIKTTYVKEVVKVTEPTPSDVNVSEERDDLIKTGVEEPFEPDVETSKRFSNEMEVKVLSPEIETQELPAEKDSLGMMHEEEQTTRVDLDEVPQIKETPKIFCSENLGLGIVEEQCENEEIEQQKSLMYNMDHSQVAELDCTGVAHAKFSPENSIETHTLHTKLSPQASLGRSSKRKLSEEQRTSDSPVHKQNSSKRQEVDKISTKTDEQQVSASATSQRKCKDMHTTSPPKTRHETPFLGKTASKLVSDRFLRGVTSLNKITKPALIQAPRSLLRTPGKLSKAQEQTASLVEVKSPITPLPNIRAVKKPIMLGGLRSPSLPSPAQQKRSLYQKLQLGAARDLSNTTLQERNRSVAEKQLEGPTIRKTSSVAVLSKSKATGALREACGKAFKFDVATSSKGTAPRPISNSSAGLEKLGSIEVRDEKLPTCNVEKPDQETAINDPVAENLKSGSDGEMVQREGEEHLWADDGLNEKSEYYANRMDRLLKEMKDKYEEAMDLRVRAIVINNAFLMLNNPVDDEKIRKITQYAREKLCLGAQGPVVM